MEKGRPHRVVDRGIAAAAAGVAAGGAAAGGAAEGAATGGWTPAAAAAGGAPVGPQPVVYGDGCTARLLFSRMFPSAETRWRRLAVSLPAAAALSLLSLSLSLSLSLLQRLSRCCSITLLLLSPPSRLLAVAAVSFAAPAAVSLLQRLSPFGLFCRPHVAVVVAAAAVLQRRLYTPLPTDGELLGCFFSQVLVSPRDDVTSVAAAAAGPGSASAAAAAAMDWGVEQQQQQQLFFYDVQQETVFRELTWPCGPLLLLAVPRWNPSVAAAANQQQQQRHSTAAAAAAAAGGGAVGTGDTGCVLWDGEAPRGSSRAAAVAAAATAAAAATGFLWPVAFVRRPFTGSNGSGRCSCGCSCSTELVAVAALALEEDVHPEETLPHNMQCFQSLQVLLLLLLLLVATLLAAAAAAAAALRPAAAAASRQFRCCRCWQHLLFPDSPWGRLLLLLLGLLLLLLLLLLQTTAAFGFLDDLLDLFIATLPPAPVSRAATAAAAAAVAAGGSGGGVVRGVDRRKDTVAGGSSAAGETAAAPGRQGTGGPTAPGAPSLKRRALGGFGLLLQLAAPFGRPLVTELRRLQVLLRLLQSAPPGASLETPVSKAAAAAAAAAGATQQQQQQGMHADLVLPPKPVFEGPPQSLAALRRKALAAVSSLGWAPPHLQGAPRGPPWYSLLACRFASPHILLLLLLLLLSLLQRGLLDEAPAGGTVAGPSEIRALLCRGPHQLPGASGTAAATAAAAAGDAAAELSPLDGGQAVCFRRLQLLQWRKKLQEQQQQLEEQQEQQQQLEEQQEQQQQQHQQEWQWSGDSELSAAARAPLGPHVSPLSRGGAPNNYRGLSSAAVPATLPEFIAPARHSTSSTSGGRGPAEGSPGAAATGMKRGDTSDASRSPAPTQRRGDSSSSSSNSNSSTRASNVCIEIHIKETFNCQLKGRDDAEIPQQEMSVAVRETSGRQRHSRHLLLSLFLLLVSP